MIVSTLIVCALGLLPFSAQAQDYQGQAMKVSNTMDADNIVEIAAASDAHTTLVAALKAGGLVETLMGDGPFTVFAPTNAAFDKLPDGTVASLLEPENKDALVNILTYHVVAGNLDATSVVKAINAGNGKAAVETLQGGTLTAMFSDEGEVQLMDEQGNVANVTATDLKGSNGVIHVIDTVVLHD